MVKMTVIYKGDLHCSIEHLPSHSMIETDAPVDNQGKGEAFSPTDLLGASLASCIATTIGIVAKRKGLDVSNMRVDVEKVMSKEAPRRIVKLPVSVFMPLTLDGDERKLIEKSAASCPVHQSLHPDIEVSITFIWPS